MKTIGVLSAAVVAGLISGWIAWGGDEVQPAVFFVFGFAAVFGYLTPRFAPATAILVGSGVPAVYALSALLGHPSPYGPEPNNWASIVAIIPAGFGAALGAGLRLILRAAASEIRNEGPRI
jgi:hypothetical protein